MLVVLVARSGSYFNRALNLLVPLGQVCAKTNSCGNQMEFADETTKLSAFCIQPTSLIAVYCSIAEAHMAWFRNETLITIRQKQMTISLCCVISANKTEREIHQNIRK